MYIVIITVTVCGFFIDQAFAGNNVSLIPTTNLYSGPEPCAKRLKEKIATINKNTKLSQAEREDQIEQATADNEKTCYEFLEPLPAVDDTGNPAEATAIEITPSEGISGSFNNLYGIAIGIGSVLAVIMIAVYGFKYMSGNKSVYENSALKEKITNVLLGVLLLLGIYVILQTINPELLDTQPEITGQDIKALALIDTGGDEESPVFNAGQIQSVNKSFKQFADKNGIYCPESGGASQVSKIAESMVGKITYSMPKRGSAGPAGTWYLDCSLFVHTVYSCAGLPTPGQTTSTIFPNTTKIDYSKLSSTSVNGKALKPGDLMGWMKGSEGPKKESNGHVIMYIGNGKAIESTSGNSGKNPGGGVQIKDANKYDKRLTRIKVL